MTERFHRVRRNRWIMALACLPFALALAAIVAGIVVAGPIAGFAFHGIGLGIFTSLYAYRRNAKACNEK